MTMTAAAVVPELVPKQVSFKNILFATDLSRDSDRALPYVLSLTRKHGAKLTVAHVITSFALEDPVQTLAVQSFMGQAVREAKEAIAILEPRLANVRHNVLIRKGDVGKQVSDLIHQYQIDLVVTGTHGRKGVCKLLKGSTAEQIFRQSHCPVLTVGPYVSGEAASVVDTHEILFPTDFSPESLAALPYALLLARENQSRLYLMHVAEGPIAECEEAILRSRLLALVPPDVRMACRPKGLVETGDPAEKITEVAEELGVDLIVVGTKRVPAITGVVTHLGMATAYKIACRALCPILSVRG